MKPRPSGRSLLSRSGTLVTLLLLLPAGRAHACDPNCDAFVFGIAGTPAAAGTILLAPLIGRIVDRRPNSPYLQALAFTVLGAGIGWGIGAAVTFPSGEQVEESTAAGLAALPVLLGSAATFLIYRFWPRGVNRESAVGPRLLPVVSVTPSAKRASIGATWRL